MGRQVGRAVRKDGVPGEGRRRGSRVQCALSFFFTGRVRARAGLRTQT